MKLAISALEDPPVRPRVTQVARPLDQCVVRLDHFEVVGTVVCQCHFGTGNDSTGDGEKECADDH